MSPGDLVTTISWYPHYSTKDFEVNHGNDISMGTTGLVVETHLNKVRILTTSGFCCWVGEHILRHV